MGLLNPKGSFCFITSNSWLDVGYGADLQEFLLRYCRVKMILDNQIKRSFATADVNTVITLFSAPSERPGTEELNNIARFVMFIVSFERVLSSDIFRQIEKTQERTVTPEYRVYPISQRTLLEEGFKQSEAEEDTGTSIDMSEKTAPRLLMKEAQATYTANKWGGKYLRAPAIYWIVLEKGKGKLIPLDAIAEVRFGIKTGANEFFYLDTAKAQQWKIEDEFLQPVIKSPQECKSILIDPNALKSRLFLCHKTKEELKGTAALEYIKWGESQAFRKNPSLRRPRWWSVQAEAANSIFVKEAHDTSAVFYNPHRYPADCRLYYANLPTATLVFFNSAIGAMLFEIYNRAGLGEGARSMMVSDYLQVPALGASDKNEDDLEYALKDIYSLPPRKLLTPKKEEWNNLDTIIFDALNLTQGERDGVYEAVIELVEARLKKADSLKVSQQRRKRLEAVDKTLGIWIGLPEEEHEGEVESHYA